MKAWTVKKERKRMNEITKIEIKEKHQHTTTIIPTQIHLTHLTSKT
jgi:hypothetical protein